MISNTLSKFEHNFILQLFLHRGDLYQIVHLKNWVGVHFTNWHLTLGSWWSWSFLACINFLEMKSSVYEDVGKYSNFNAKFGDFFFSIIFWRTKYYVYNFKFDLMGNLLTINSSFLKLATSLVPTPLNQWPVPMYNLIVKMLPK